MVQLKIVKIKDAMCFFIDLFSMLIYIFICLKIKNKLIQQLSAFEFELLINIFDL